MTLEKLLNILCEKGWKPFNIPGITELKYYETKQKLRITSLQNDIEYHDEFSLRDICSSESGLWQFVCENEMVKNVNDYSWELYSGTHGQHEVYKNGYEGGERWEQVDYEYRLIESALCDEDKLEQFLLNNIKI